MQCFSDLNASSIVYKNLHFTERQFRYIASEESLLQHKSNFKKLMQNGAVTNFAQNLELFLPKHPVTEEFIHEDLHEIQLVKNITDVFLKCRMHHHAKLLNFRLHGKASSIRQKMTKLILFKNC